MAFQCFRSESLYSLKIDFKLPSLNFKSMGVVDPEFNSVSQTPLFEGILVEYLRGLSYPWFCAYCVYFILICRRVLFWRPRGMSPSDSKYQFIFIVDVCDWVSDMVLSWTCQHWSIFSERSFSTWESFNQVFCWMFLVFFSGKTNQYRNQLHWGFLTQNWWLIFRSESFGSFLWVSPGRNSLVSALVETSSLLHLVTFTSLWLIQWFWIFLLFYAVPQLFLVFFFSQTHPTSTSLFVLFIMSRLYHRALWLAWQPQAQPPQERVAPSKPE